ncbi:hypothetical protein NliqN6_0594 [Naganishia liquefaciens]|uniref:WD40 repeat domain-containing protein n=1 Tax=Naganishia liquefaciens TaxID=104408 RepID=A0A8H3YDD4_9TREE|nr:hypothetical protein NliqN6_0594 [Naganishia liquefaciens]
MTELQTLPYVDIQHDALAVFDDVSQNVVAHEDVWMSCYQIGQASVHGKMSLSREESGIQGVGIKGLGGIEADRSSHTTFTVSAKTLGIEKQRLRFPRQTVIPPLHTSPSVPLSINAIDVSPDGSQLVYGGPDGYCYVHPLSATSEDRVIKPLELKGHVGDVLDVKWFPSGSVVLTAATDATIRIFSAESGINPRTLKGHKRAVTTLDVLGVGRNVLSGSKDGSIKLWDVSQGVCLTSIYAEGFAGVEKIVTGKHAKEISQGIPTANDPEHFTPKHVEGEIPFDTTDKLLFAGLSSSAGTLSLYDLGSKQPIVRAFPHIPSTLVSSPTLPATAKGGAIHSVAYDPDRYLLASGSARGIIVIRDIRMLDKDGAGALHVVRRTEAAINDLAFVQPSSDSSAVELVIAPESGLPCRLGIPRDGAHPITCIEEYAGWEPVSIESIAVGREGQVWVSGAEGGIRRY